MTTIPAELHPEQMLTTEQVAAITGISKPTLESWRCRKNENAPPVVKLGPQLIRYRWRDLRAWMDARATAA